MAAARNTSSLTQIEVVFTESLLAAFGSVKVIYTILLSIKIVLFLFDITCLQFYLINEKWKPISVQLSFKGSIYACQSCMS